MIPARRKARRCETRLASVLIAGLLSANCAASPIQRLTVATSESQRAAILAPLNDDELVQIVRYTGPDELEVAIRHEAIRRIRSQDVILDLALHTRPTDVRFRALLDRLTDDRNIERVFRAATQPTAEEPGGPQIPPEAVVGFLNAIRGESALRQMAFEMLIRNLPLSGGWDTGPEYVLSERACVALIHAAPRAQTAYAAEVMTSTRRSDFEKAQSISYWEQERVKNAVALLGGVSSPSQLRRLIDGDAISFPEVTRAAAKKLIATGKAQPALLAILAREHSDPAVRGLAAAALTDGVLLKEIILGSDQDSVKCSALRAVRDDKFAYSLMSEQRTDLRLPAQLRGCAIAGMTDEDTLLRVATTTQELWECSAALSKIWHSEKIEAELDNAKGLNKYAFLTRLALLSPEMMAIIGRTSFSLSDGESHTIYRSSDGEEVRVAVGHVFARVWLEDGKAICEKMFRGVAPSRITKGDLSHLGGTGFDLPELLECAKAGVVK